MQVYGRRDQTAPSEGENGLKPTRMTRLSTAHYLCAFRAVHVLKAGQYGLLLPEVSGARHTREDSSVFNRLND